MEILKNGQYGKKGILVECDRDWETVVNDSSN